MEQFRILLLNLKKENLITDKEIEELLNRIKKTGESLLKILVFERKISEEKILEEVSKIANLPKIYISNHEIENEVVNLFTPEFCREHLIFPLFKVNEEFLIAFFDPFDSFLIDEIKMRIKSNIKIFLTTPTEILNAIRVYYKTTEKFLSAIHHATTKTLPEINPLETRPVVEEVDAPIIKAVDLLIQQAINDRATDIHLDPEDDYVRIKFRIDGIIHEIMTIPKQIQESFISRIKIMAGMDIGEKRLPQDGNILFNANGEGANLRVATYPTVKGEKVHLRIFPVGKLVYHLEEIGLMKDDLLKVKNYISKQFGLILITGPTGSGKTTTLYSIVEKLSKMNKVIATIEEPVEVELENLNQSEVNIEKGWTFSSALRSILRIDPDVVVIGEMRDIETVKLGIQSALTGHLVISTLHTKDSFSAPIRLIDMKVEPFLLSSSLLCVISQRLVRLICPYCKDEYMPDEKIIEKLNIKKSIFYKGKGCKNCNNTGFLGRTGIFEVMEINQELQKAIQEKATSFELKNICKKYNMKTMIDNAIELINEGKIVPEEILGIIEGV